MDDEPERWIAVPGYEGRYEVSSLGKLRRLGFYVNRKANSRAWWPPANVKGTRRKTGARYVQFSLVAEDGKKTCWYAQRLVLTAFRGAAPPRTEGCHEDGDTANNALANLRWGTRSSNMHDQVRHGRHANAKKEACPLDHPLEGFNLAPRKESGRGCQACQLTNMARWTAEHRIPPAKTYRPRRGGFVRIETETFREEADRRYAWLRDRATP